MEIPFHNGWRRLWQDAPPGLACEFTPGGVGVARWVAGSPRLERMAVRPLPVDALRAQPVRENIANVEAVAGAVHSALEDAQSVNVGKRRREISVLLPDLSARVSVLTFDQVPDKHEEALSLIKFRLKKTVPFDIEEAAISWEAAGNEITVAVTPRGIVRQYESLFEQLGYLPGRVAVSTLAGIHLMVDSGEPNAGSMLLRKTGRAMTIAISSKGRLRMMRTLDLAAALDMAAEADETIDAAGLFHDIYSSAVFYQDTYGAAVDRIVETGFGDQAEPLWAQIEAELGVRPKPLIIPGTTPGAEGDEQSPYLGIFGMLAEQAVRS
jgi:type IV pilus assembly protein PilM